MRSPPPHCLALWLCQWFAWTTSAMLAVSMSCAQIRLLKLFTWEFQHITLLTWCTTCWFRNWSGHLLLRESPWSIADNDDILSRAVSCHGENRLRDLLGNWQAFLQLKWLRRGSDLLSISSHFSMDPVAVVDKRLLLNRCRSRMSQNWRTYSLTKASLSYINIFFSPRQSSAWMLLWLVCENSFLLAAPNCTFHEILLNLVVNSWVLTSSVCWHRWWWILLEWLLHAQHAHSYWMPARFLHFLRRSPCLAWACKPRFQHRFLPVLKILDFQRYCWIWLHKFYDNMCPPTKSWWSDVF